MSNAVNNDVYQKIVKEARLGAIIDCIVYNLQENSINFNEDRLRITLNQIQDDKTLMHLNSFSSQIRAKGTVQE